MFNNFSNNKTWSAVTANKHLNHLIVRIVDD